MSEPIEVRSDPHLLVSPEGDERVLARARRILEAANAARVHVPSQVSDWWVDLGRLEDAARKLEPFGFAEAVALMRHAAAELRTHRKRDAESAAALNKDGTLPMGCSGGVR